MTEALEVSPVVIVMGARQTGKSTLVQTLSALSEHASVTLDDLDVLGQAREAPDDLVHRSPRLIIDEVQRAPELLLAIKRAVDVERPRRTGRFVLTGSANLLLMKQVSETLAGRSTHVPLWPLTRGERAGRAEAGIWASLFDEPVESWLQLVEARDVEPADWRAEARLGGYPTPAHELDSDRARTLWFDGYVRTFLERDLRALSAIENLPDFRRLMEAACLRIGGLVNQADIGRDTGVPRPTAHRYLNLLEVAYQLIRLRPYSVNRTKRLIKAPKMYWSDTGLARFLTGVGEIGGNLLENLIVGDLMAWRDARVPRPEVLFWRTASGQEVDLVIEERGRLLPIEVKATKRPSHRDVRHLQVFREEYADTVKGGLLLHCGDETFWVTREVLATPWWRVL